MILIFDSNGGLLEFDNSNGVNTSYTYIEPVSVGLIESASLFFFEEYWSTTTNEKVYLKPLPEYGHTRKFKFTWLESINSDKIYLYTIDDNKTTITVTDSIIVDTLDAFSNTWNGFINDLPSTMVFDPSFFQINIALTSDTEESLSRTLIVTEIIDSIESEICRVIVYGETEGEDQRYKIMINNFRDQLNIDDKDSILAFRETDIKEENIDYEIYNRKRKELIIAGTEIIPYMGSYRGLINALNYFGYSDMRIREYWLNIDSTSENFNKYSYINVKDQSDGKLTTNFDLLPVDGFKKTNLFGLFYDINRVIPEEFDEFGIPKVEDVDLFSPDEVIIKLAALQRKLKKDFLPLSTKIIDVVGEGVYFELFRSKIWLEEVNTIQIDKTIEIDFDIETPMGSLQLNQESNLKDFIYDLRPLEVVWDTFPAFSEDDSYNQFSIINHLNSKWISTTSISPGPFNQVDWIELTGINSLQDITADNPIFSGVPLDSFINQLVAYFSNIKGNELPYEWPDSEGIPAGCPVVLKADFSGLTWDQGDSEWDSVYGDIKEAEEYDAGTVYQIGDYTRYQGKNYVAIAITTGSFVSGDWSEVESTSFSWDNLDTTDLYEMTWIVTNPERNYKFEITGLVNAIKDVNDNIIQNSIQTYPLILPYTGDYTVELRVRSTFNDVVYKRKPSILTINSKSCDFVCFAYMYDELESWDNIEETWNDVGSVWVLPSKESSTWDEADLEWDSTNFAKYINNQPENILAYFGYEAYYWDNLPYNDWDELGSTTWGMLERQADSLGGFDVKINNDDFATFNSNINQAKIGNSTETVTSTINSYQDLADWFYSIDNQEFKSFEYSPFPLDAPDRMRAVAKFSDEYGFYKDWTLDGYYQLNDKGSVTLFGEGWLLIWNTEFTWDELEQEWDEESPIYDSLPKNIDEPGDFIIPPVNIFTESFEIFTLVPIFIVPDNCKIPGKTNFHWEIWDHEKGYMLFQIDHPYIIWTFTSEGIYSIKMSCYDSNGNFKEDEKIGWIKVNTKTQVNSFLRRQRVLNSIENPPSGIEYTFVIEGQSTPLTVS